MKNKSPANKSYTQKEIVAIMAIVFIIVSAIVFSAAYMLGEDAGFSAISGILIGILAVLPISLWWDRQQRNAKPLEWKKFLIAFTGILVLCAIAIGYSHFSTPKPKNIIMYSLAKDYCFAVDAPYDGDKFDAGAYHFYQDNVNTQGKAKGWDIYISDKPVSNSSGLSDASYAGIVGTYENNELSLEIPSGRYVYVKFRGNEKSEGSLEVDLTKHK